MKLSKCPVGIEANTNPSRQGSPQTARFNFLVSREKAI